MEHADKWQSRKINRTYYYIFKCVEKKDVQFSLDLVNDKITDITIAKPIERITIDLGIDKDGNVTVTV